MKLGFMILSSMVVYPFLIYITVRLISAGYFHSKMEFIKKVDMEVLRNGKEKSKQG